MCARRVWAQKCALNKLAYLLSALKYSPHAPLSHELAWLATDLCEGAQVRCPLSQPLSLPQPTQKLMRSEIPKTAPIMRQTSTNVTRKPRRLSSSRMNHILPTSRPRQSPAC
jgi:hypothetical protein